MVIWIDEFPLERYKIKYIFAQKSAYSKNKKNSDNFWKRKLTLKIQFWYFVPLRKFTKYNIFLWVCWFLAKNIFNFVSLPGNLDNPYYHSMSRPMQDSRGRKLQEPWKKIRRGELNEYSFLQSPSDLELQFMGGCLLLFIIVVVYRVKLLAQNCYLWFEIKKSFFSV